MASTVYTLSTCLLLWVGTTLADVTDDIVAKTFLSTGATQHDDTLLKLLPEELPAEDAEVQSNAIEEDDGLFRGAFGDPVEESAPVPAPAPAPSNGIVIGYSSDVLEPYAEQAASLGEVAIRRISIQRLSGTGEYCAAAHECASQVCILNRCCGSTRSICRKLECTADPQRQCYIEDLPCTSQVDCHVSPTCAHDDPCSFTRCSAGHYCKVVQSCILPPRAQCVPTAGTCDSIQCPPNSVCTLEGTYPPTPTCNILLNVTSVGSQNALKDGNVS